MNSKFWMAVLVGGIVANILDFIVQPSCLQTSFTRI